MAILELILGNITTYLILVTEVHNAHQQSHISFNTTFDASMACTTTYLNTYRYTHIYWRKLHNDELKNLYSSPSIVRVIKSRRMRWAGHVERMDGTRGVHQVLVGKPEGKRLLGRPRRRCEDNLRQDLWEIGIEGDWILLAQDRVQRALVSSVMNLRVR
ncbi:hypothetical protein L798_12144 [Zootermopsis nevadensis]|uniref:Uncharacterized protein n=1 Tax=Zootermopsis nevadensis TaxID=136037 RepID=A0A067QUG6_ZOONE|nr:hypothetical protein L798_12144 [Zootermopsis nevadensis]